MVKLAWAPVSAAFAAVGCSGSAAPPLPPVWSATYDVPFNAMVDCLSTKPSSAFAVSAPEFFQEGVMRISFTPAKTPEVPAAYTLRRAGSGTQVIWRRPANADNMQELDKEARSRADRCASS